MIVVGILIIICEVVGGFFTGGFSLLGLAWAMLPAFIAKAKGHHFWNWFVYATFLFPIALIHSIFVKRIREEVENTKMKDENL